jgi:hypothetical protein
MSQTKITKSARGEACTVRIPGICNFNPQTTIFAHINGIRFGHGTGHKVEDLHGAYCCNSCHDVIDARVKTGLHSREAIKLMHYEGVLETQGKLVEKGLVRV